MHAHAAGSIARLALRKRRAKPNTIVAGMSEIIARQLRLASAWLGFSFGDGDMRERIRSHHLRLSDSESCRLGVLFIGFVVVALSYLLEILEYNILTKMPKFITPNREVK